MAKAKKYDMRTWPMLFKQCDGKVMEWEIWVEEQNDGTGLILTRFGYSGGTKQVKKDHVKKGKKLGTKAETTPYEQAVLDAESEWKTKLKRKGYGETADASAEFRSASPMLAKTFNGKHVIDWATAFAQPKLDGFRCLATKDGKGVKLRSREGQPLQLPHLVEELGHAMEPGETFDGELYSHDLSFQQISSLVKKRNHPEATKILLHCYDAVADKPFETRFGRVREALSQGYDYLSVVKTVKVRSREEMAVVESDALKDGYEGAMLRHGRKGYEPSKRAAQLLKVKTFEDAEFVVVDAKEGRGSYAGIAIFTCETKDGHNFDVTAPGSLPEKRAFWDKHQEFIGKKLTVKFQGLTTGEEPVPRFPVAKAFRE